jgi:pimeloyl-ACP methyl ester carboxylesterase
MTTVNVNGIAVGIESFGADDAPLVLLAGGTTMLSWPDALCERLAAGGRRVVRYDLRDSGESTMTDPEAPAYNLRDLAADAAALADALGAGPAHLAGIGVGGMVAQVAVLDHPGAFSALTLVGTRAVAPGPPDDDLPDHDQATMSRLFARPVPDWADRAAVAEFAAGGAEILGDDPFFPVGNGEALAHEIPVRGCSCSNMRRGRSPKRPPVKFPQRCLRSSRIASRSVPRYAASALWAKGVKSTRGKGVGTTCEVRTVTRANAGGV